MVLPRHRLGSAAPRRVPRNSALALALGALIILTGMSPDLVAATSGDPEAQLESVRKRIRELDQRLNRTRMKRDKLATGLRDTELAVARFTAELAALERQRAAHRTRLVDLERRRGKTRDKLADVRTSLARYVRAAYATGRQDQFKLLLNQENPATLSRALTYYAYFNRERADRIHALAMDLQKLADIEDSIARDTDRLARLHEQKATARERLADQRQRRRGVIARLARELGDQDARRERLRQDEQTLAKLVAGLARELADIPVDQTRQVPFRTLKGKLPWPSAGKIRHRFGTPRGSGDLNWKGVLVTARPGTPVLAISHGRVAFADWLRGFGLLMIIEHGDGYMSLYGHSESLFKDVGDWVEAGELIGKVGDSGGRETSGLYFEIRHLGTPVNPMRWFGRGPAAQSAALKIPVGDVSP
ncbi:MAG: peptidoglycan DD-metalloendopeptidase family protein [Gammaproteobacteria bacterium]